VLHAQFSKAPVPFPPILAEHKLGEVLRWVLEKDPARRAGDVQPILERLKQLDTRDLVDSSGFLRLAVPTTSEGGVFPPTETSLLARAEGERRPTTALCCRIALGQPIPQANEEALDEWLSDLREEIAQTAGRHGAVLAGYGGGELLFYLGAVAGDEASTRR